MRVVQKEDLQRVFDHFAPKAVELFNRDGEVQPALFTVQLGDTPEADWKQMAMVPSAVVNALQFDQRTKNMLGALMRELLLPRGDKTRTRLGLDHVDVVVHISEAWVSQQPVNAGETPQQAAERDRMAPKDDPNRTETVIVGMHTADGSYVGYCPILDDPRRCELGKLELEGQHIGRLMPLNPEVRH